MPHHGNCSNVLKQLTIAGRLDARKVILYKFIESTIANAVSDISADATKPSSEQIRQRLLRSLAASVNLQQLPNHVSLASTRQVRRAENLFDSDEAPAPKKVRMVEGLFCCECREQF